MDCIINNIDKNNLKKYYEISNKPIINEVVINEHIINKPIINSSISKN